MSSIENVDSDIDYLDDHTIDLTHEPSSASAFSSPLPPLVSSAPLPSSSQSHHSATASKYAHRSVEFTGGKDFIGFLPSSDGESEEESRSPKRNGREPEPQGLLKRKRSPFQNGNEEPRRKLQRQDAPRQTPWMRYVQWDSCRNVAEMLQEEASAFERYITPTKEEDQVREIIVESIRTAITATFPDAELLPFGSFDTKLYLPMGDIDLVLRSKEMALHDKKQILYTLARILKKAQVTDQVTVVAKAKVPILKFVTRTGHIPVDISINQENGLVAGSVIKRFLAEIPAVRPIVLAIKLFLSQRGINEVFTGGLGSYSVVLMVISFLQMHPKIRRAEIKPSRNLGVLIADFLELYGQYFNYYNVGISILDGGTYFNKHRRGWADDRGSLRLSIEDPCDISNDVARGSYNMQRVRAAFSGAFQALSIAMYAKASSLAEKREQLSRRDRERGYERSFSYSEQDYSSILGSFIGVTDELIEQRQNLHSIWRSLPDSEKPSRNGQEREGSSSSPNHTTSPTRDNPTEYYSIADEIDMELSEGEIQNTYDQLSISEREDEEESRYSALGRDRKRAQTAVTYVSDEEHSDDDPPGNLLSRLRSPIGRRDVRSATGLMIQPDGRPKSKQSRGTRVVNGAERKQNGKR